MILRFIVLFEYSATLNWWLYTNMHAGIHDIIESLKLLTLREQ
jgi:hypothetical protein